MTYIILRSTLPMWFCVGSKYLFSTGGALSLPLFMYWGFFFALGITMVLFAKNLLEDYVQTRFLHRIVKQIINTSDDDDFKFDGEEDSLQKVSFALKKYIESYQPLDKAGGYGIQDNPDFIKKIYGDYYSIMGLPVNRLLKICSYYGIVK